MPDEKPTTLAEQKALQAEIRADEHAARVRAYGETDAATHVARMEEAYRYREQVIGPAPPVSPPVTAKEMERALNELEESWDTPQGRFKAIMRGDSPSVEQASVEQETGHER